MLRCHIGGDRNNAAFFDPLKTEIKGGFITPVYRGNNTDSLGGPIGAALAVAEHIVKLHNRRHFQIHAEIRRQHRAVSGEFFDVAVRILPDSFKTIVIQEEMNHTVKMILILRMSFVKTDQQKIIKVSGVLLKLGNDRDFNFPFPGN